MSSFGSKASESTKKLKWKLDMEFGKSLTFFTENRHVCILPNNLKKEVLAAAEYIQLSSKLEAFQERHKDNTIVQTAMSLWEQIKSTLSKDDWPPKSEELTSDYIQIPPSLLKFLHNKNKTKLLKLFNKIKIVWQNKKLKTKRNKN